MHERIMLKTKRKQLDTEQGVEHSRSGQPVVLPGSGPSPAHASRSPGCPALGARLSAFTRTKGHILRVLLGFAAGVLITYACLSRSGPALAAQLQRLSDACTSQRPPEISLSPLALSKATGEAGRVNDRLLVVARHREVCTLILIVDKHEPFMLISCRVA